MASNVWKVKKVINSKLIHPVRSPILKANYYLDNYKEVIWLIGDGRSGTTWVSDLIKYKQKYREMYEPFHPHHVNRMRRLVPNQYIRPYDSNNQIQDIASDVFSGKFLDPKVDAHNYRILYKGLLIKDIFANLFACWVSNHFPAVKIILLIRNPFYVALSKYKKRDWYWMTNPLDFLDQPDLYDDYLHSFEDLIRRVNTEGDYIQRQILIWSIIYYVPLLQFQPNQIHIVFYEDLVADPSNVRNKIFSHVKHNSNEQDSCIPDAIVNRPSSVTDKARGVFTAVSPATFWKNELTVNQIDSGLNILSNFGFENLYRENLMPNRKIVDNMLAKDIAG